MATKRPAAAPAPQFALRLETHGDTPALNCGGRTVCYAELASLADAFAARLPPQVRLLAIHMGSEIEAVAAYLGSLRAGVPAILHAGGAGAALTGCPPDARYERSPGGEGWILVETPAPWDAPPAAELATLLSTSGSTGSGKLVRLSGANLQANAQSICEYLGITAAERAITSLPLSYSYGLSVLNSHLNAGALIVLNELSVAEPEFREVMEGWGVTSLAGVPHSWELMDRSGLLDALPRSVHTLTQAGGRMGEDLTRRIAAVAQREGRRLFVMYGQTEATARIAYLPPEELPERIGCIGRAIPGGELWVETEAGRAPMGAEGELVYRGPNVMMGYAETRADLAAPRGSDVLRTGDLGVEVDPGLFRITGRKSRFVKLFGLRVSLDEVERRMAAAGVEAHLAGDDALVAIAVRDAAAAGKGCGVLEEMALPLDPFEFVVAAEFPRLPGGKIDYRAVLALAVRQRERARGRAARNPFAAVEERFARLAKGRAPSPDDTFQGLGGDSLTYVQMSLELESALGRVPEGWEAMTLADLRALAAKADAGSRWWMAIETDAALRAVSILMVVALHAGVGLPGGAFILMMLAGYTWQRFQQPRLLRGGSVEVFRDYALRFLPPYLFMVLLYFALRGVFWVPHLLFINTWVHGKAELLQIYWFMETLTWCVGLLCALFLAPPLRRWVSERPQTSAFAFLAAALALRLGGAQVLDPVPTLGRTPDQILFYFALGWTFAATRNPHLRALALALVALSYRPSTAVSIPMFVAAAGMLMIATPKITLPRPIARAVMQLSAASFFIYLLHPMTMYVRDLVLYAPTTALWPVQILAGVVLGLVANAFLQRVDLARLWPARRGDHGSAPASAI